ncbi:MAG: hypothetical protein ACK4SF_05320 [Algoriphagus aquaeductus]|uniref:hypothetical protein n=1 Tax=Algoriphagus aquaeductus TaxID=475299 RepID=UPI0011B6BAE9|nr:hypothetical protein [Algoriphagus aquaeductus]
MILGKLNLDYAIEFVARTQNVRKSGTLDPDSYREKSEVKRLILSAAADEIVVDFLMHISG